jgi:hypothetical protein
MKRLTALCLLALPLIALGAAPPPAKPTPGPLASCALIRDGDRTVGSGVQIERGGKAYILTCAHVVADWHVTRTARYGDLAYTETYVKTAQAVVLDGEREVKKSCQIRWYDAKRDVALLEPDCDCSLVPARLPAAVKLKAGDDLVFCGGGVEDWCLGKSWLARRKDGHLLIGAGILWFGNSGSGVWRGGELVGIASALYNSGHYRLAVAIDLETINASLRDHDASEDIKARTQAD